MFPKDRDSITKQSNIIYWFRCGRTEYGEEYIGEAARTFEDRYKEHLKALSPIFEHQNFTGHITTVENFKIIAREGQNIARAIKEKPYTSESTTSPSVEILANTTCHTFWNKVLFAIPELKTK